jgi:hypothetical protein
MKIAKTFSLILPVVVALLITSGQSRAGFVDINTTPPPTFNQLLGSDSQGHNFTTVADKTLTFLNYSSTTVAASAISISALTQSANGVVTPYGFQLSGSFSASGASAASDVAITYTVTSSGAPITAINLFANFAILGSGNADVTESVFTIASNGGAGVLLGNLSVNPNTSSASLDLTQFNPAGYSGLYITKDIEESTGASGGMATISIVQQAFPEAVPEPASIAMTVLGLGLASAYAFSRSRRKAVNA